MARLISDASKMTDVQKELGITVKDGEMDFANIANAISVVQKNMGIMGTTAEEADETISGSLNAMKASWSNLLTAVADDNADLDASVSAFSDSVITALSNIAPRIVPIITGLGEAIKNIVSQLIPQIFKDIVPMIQPALLEIQQKIPSMLEKFGTKFNEFAPRIAEYGSELLLKLGAGFLKALPTLISALGSVMNGLLKIVVGIPALMLAQGLMAIGKFALGILKGINKVLTNASKVVAGVINTIKKLPSKLLTAGFNAIKSFASGISRGISTVVSNARNLANGAIEAVKNRFNNIGNIGLNLVKGIWNGISNGTSWIKSRIRNWVGSVTDFLKKLFKIGSPSKLYEDEIGKNLALGIGIGFSNEMKEVEKQMGNAIPKQFNTSTNNINGARYSGSSSVSNDMVSAFKEALSEMKIELDDEVAGHFVEKTVTKIVFA